MTEREELYTWGTRPRMVSTTGGENAGNAVRRRQTSSGSRTSRSNEHAPRERAERLKRVGKDSEEAASIFVAAVSIKAAASSSCALPGALSPPALPKRKKGPGRARRSTTESEQSGLG